MYRQVVGRNSAFQRHAVSTACFPARDAHGVEPQPRADLSASQNLLPRPEHPTFSAVGLLTSLAPGTPRLVKLDKQPGPTWAASASALTAALPWLI